MGTSQWKYKLRRRFAPLQRPSVQNCSLFLIQMPNWHWLEGASHPHTTWQLPSDHPGHPSNQHSGLAATWVRSFPFFHRLSTFEKTSSRRWFILSTRNTERQKHENCQQGNEKKKKRKSQGDMIRHSMAPFSSWASQVLKGVVMLLLNKPQGWSYCVWGLLLEKGEWSKWHKNVSLTCTCFLSKFSGNVCTLMMLHRAVLKDWRGSS